jgi:hypothetical protein
MGRVRRASCSSRSSISSERIGCDRTDGGVRSRISSVRSHGSSSVRWHISSVQLRGWSVRLRGPRRCDRTHLVGAIVHLVGAMARLVGAIARGLVGAIAWIFVGAMAHLVGAIARLVGAIARASSVRSHERVRAIAPIAPTRSHPPRQRDRTDFVSCHRTGLVSAIAVGSAGAPVCGGDGPAGRSAPRSTASTRSESSTGPRERRTPSTPPRAGCRGAR